MWMKEVIEITKPKLFIAENVKRIGKSFQCEGIIQQDFPGQMETGISCWNLVFCTPQITVFPNPVKGDFYRYT